MLGFFDFLIASYFYNRLPSEAQKYSKDQKLVSGNTGDCMVIKKNETHFEFSEIACNAESYFICEVGKSIRT